MYAGNMKKHLPTDVLDYRQCQESLIVMISKFFCALSPNEFRSLLSLVPLYPAAEELI